MVTRKDSGVTPSIDKNVDFLMTMGSFVCGQTEQKKQTSTNMDRYFTF
jgi:hypothetical protein